ncbi:unnamed protein product, partial [Trichogramma brassicae]
TRQSHSQWEKRSWTNQRHYPRVHFLNEISFGALYRGERVESHRARRCCCFCGCCCTGGAPRISSGRCTVAICAESACTRLRGNIESPPGRPAASVWSFLSRAAAAAAAAAVCTARRSAAAVSPCSISNQAMHSGLSCWRRTREFSCPCMCSISSSSSSSREKTRIYRQNYSPSSGGRLKLCYYTIQSILCRVELILVIYTSRASSGVDTVEVCLQRWGAIGRKTLYIEKSIGFKSAHCTRIQGIHVQDLRGLTLLYIRAQRSTRLTHFHVACMTGSDYAVEKFLEFGLDPNFCSTEIRKSPLQIALSKNHKNIVRLLMKGGADPNSADADGSTHLHIICKEPKSYDLATMLFEICDEVNKTVLVNPQDTFGNTPLLLALQFMGHGNPTTIVEVLLRRGAYLNLANNDGLMPLHIMCDTIGYDSIMSGLDVEIYQPVQVDARDQFGNTPLQVALTRRHRNLAELLLRNGADPNLTNAEGLTPLQIICKGDHDDDLAEMFFKVNSDTKQTVNIDVQDELGNAPLHLALQQGNKKKVVESLLENGANPHLANAEGLTPLHVICIKNYDEGCIIKFFEITKKMNQLVHVDARDRMGRTPLRSAPERRKVHRHEANSQVRLLPDNRQFTTPQQVILAKKRKKYFVS